MCGGYRPLLGLCDGHPFFSASGPRSLASIVDSLDHGFGRCVLVTIAWQGAGLAFRVAWGDALFLLFPSSSSSVFYMDTGPKGLRCGSTIVCEVSTLAAAVTFDVRGGPAIQVRTHAPSGRVVSSEPRGVVCRTAALQMIGGTTRLRIAQQSGDSGPCPL